MVFFSTAVNHLPVKIALVALFVFLVWRPGPTRRAGVQALLGFLLANGLTDIFKHAWPMHRPFQEMSDIIVRVGRTDSMGTASAHSANMAVVAYVFAYHLGWQGSPWILIALITGISRVYVGAHYPYQVALGWACGIFAGFCITQVGKLILQRRSSVENVKDETAAPA